MIDWARVEELRNDMGREDFDEVVELFLEEMDSRILEMKSGNSSDRTDDLHFLKGSAANIGFEKLRDICAQAEQDETLTLDFVWTCYDQSKLQFLSNPSIRIAQISTPDNTSSSVMSR